MDRVRGPTRRRCERARSTCCRSRAANRAASRHPDGRVVGEMVPRQQARGVHQPRVARPRGLGRPGPSPQGTGRVEDDRPHLGQGPDPLLGSLARRPRGARVHHRHRGRRPQAGDAWHRPAALESRDPAPTRTDISPDGAEIAFAADTDTHRGDAQLRHLSRPAPRAAPPATSRRTTRPTTDAALLTRRPRCSRSGGRRSATSTPIASAWSSTTAPPAPDAHRHRRWDRSVSGLVWMPDGARRSSARSTTRGGRRVYRSTAATGEARRLRRQSLRAIALSRDGRDPRWRCAMLLRAADARAARFDRRAAGEALHASTTPCSPTSRLGALRERHLQGVGRRRHPDVGGLPAGTSTQTKKYPGIPAAARRPAQRPAGRHSRSAGMPRCSPAGAT